MRPGRCGAAEPAAEKRGALVSARRDAQEEAALRRGPSRSAARAANALAGCSQPARLETRTKESNMHASRRARGSPRGAVKASGGSARAEARARTAGRPGSSVKGPSGSMPVGTRKMVNYA